MSASETRGLEYFSPTKLFEHLKAGATFRHSDLKLGNPKELTYKITPVSSGIDAVIIRERYTLTDSRPSPLKFLVTAIDERTIGYIEAQKIVHPYQGQERIRLKLTKDYFHKNVGVVPPGIIEITHENHEDDFSLHRIDERRLNGLLPWFTNKEYRIKTKSAFPNDCFLSTK